MGMMQRITEVPDKVFKNWQQTVDVLADVFAVPSAIVTRVDGRDIENFVSSRSEGNQFQTGTSCSISGIYCEEVINSQEMLLVDNGIGQVRWRDNIELDMGMVSYLGVPVIWPDGSVFGTLCVMDVKTNNYSKQLINLINQFRYIIETDLKLIYQDVEQRTTRHDNDIESESIESIAGKDYLSEVFNSIGEAIVTTDVNGKVKLLNLAAEKITGWQLGEVLKFPCEHVLNLCEEESHSQLTNLVEKCTAANGRLSLRNILLVDRYGSELMVEVSASMIRSGDNITDGTIFVIRDVSESRRKEKEISYHATHDALTDLVNRREFELRMNRILETRRAPGQNHVLCYMDLNHFKEVNDLYGHSAGDSVLKQICKVLKDIVRQRDTLARLGGDEFGILMEHCSTEQGSQVADKIVEMIDKQVFLWEKNTIKMGISIGLVNIDQYSQDKEILFQQADKACYEAKRSDGTSVVIYTH